MSSYLSTVAPNEKVEMIHVSADSDASAASQWAAAERFPWLTVLPEDVRASGLNRFASGFVPDYVLVGADGRKIASGKSNVFAMIKKM